MTYFGFGDSFTTGLCSDKLITDNVGYVDKIYLNFLKDELGLEGDIQTYSRPGAATTDIVSYYLENAHKIKQGDIVIIQTTTPERVLVPGENRNLMSLTYVQATQEELLDLPYKESYENTLKYATPTMTEDEISSTIKNFMQSVVINQWDVYEKYYSNLILLCANDASSRGATTVVLDYTIWFSLEELLKLNDLYCGCRHWNEKGHEVIGKLLSTCVQNKINILNESNIVSTYGRI